MKIRIAQNSIRFRLKQPEVTGFEMTGIVKEMIEFGPDEEDQMIFCLKRFEGKEMTIQMEKNKVVVSIPEDLSEQWIHTDLVGFDKKLSTDKGKTISVLIEKDFACLDATEEENVGSYPNPLANCQPIISAER
jgi:hypothetical protein